jgi:hypothetical protein
MYPTVFVESRFCGWARAKTLFQAAKQGPGVKKKVIIDPKWELSDGYYGFSLSQIRKRLTFDIYDCVDSGYTGM